MGRIKPPDTRSSRLVDALREVRIAAAERNDVVIDLGEADRARLEILAERLKPVFDDVPMDDERFDFALSSGLKPRLWIDATAHVAMARDRRTYRFVRDTRVGRIVLAESSSVDPVTAAITTYVAERVHERELAMSGDRLVSYRGAGGRPVGDRVVAGQYRAADQDVPAAQTAEPTPRRVRSSVTAVSPIGWILISLFLLFGVIVLLFQDRLQ